MQPAVTVRLSDQIDSKNLIMHIFKVARYLLIFFSSGYITYRATTGLIWVNNGEIGFVHNITQAEY